MFLVVDKFLYYPSGVSTIHERLTWARTEAGFITAIEAATAMGVEPGTYRHHENGNRGVRIDVALRYSHFFKVDPSWLITGVGSPRNGDAPYPERNSVVWVPVISWVQAGALSECDLDHFDGETVPIACNRVSIFALRVQGTSMNRVAPAGSTIIVDYEDRMLQDQRLYVFRINTETTFKRYRDTKGPRRLMPDSTDPHDPIFPDEAMEVVGRVIMVVREV